MPGERRTGDLGHAHRDHVAGKLAESRIRPFASPSAMGCGQDTFSIRFRKNFPFCGNRNVLRARSTSLIFVEIRPPLSPYWRIRGELAAINCGFLER